MSIGLKKSKIQNFSRLVTTSVFNAKTEERESKIPDAREWINTAEYNWSWYCVTAKNKQKIAAKNYFGNDGFQNTLIYQPTLILKDINDNYHVSACK